MMKDKLKKIIQNALDHEGNASKYQLENRTNLLYNEIKEIDFFWYDKTNKKERDIGYINADKVKEIVKELVQYKKMWDELKKCVEWIADELVLKNMEKLENKYIKSEEKGE